MSEEKAATSSFGTNKNNKDENIAQSLKDRQDEGDITLRHHSILYTLSKLKCKETGPR